MFPGYQTLLRIILQKSFAAAWVSSERARDSTRDEQRHLKSSRFALNPPLDVGNFQIVWEFAMIFTWSVLHHCMRWWNSTRSTSFAQISQFAKLSDVVWIERTSAFGCGFFYAGAPENKVGLTSAKTPTTPCRTACLELFYARFLPYKKHNGVSKSNIERSYEQTKSLKELSHLSTPTGLACSLVQFLVVHRSYIKVAHETTKNSL